MDRGLVAKLTAEFIGTAFLLAAVVGSGIMAETLSEDVGLQLLQNAFATAGVLTALILALGPASGAHFNPAVTLADRLYGAIDTTTATAYVAAQVSGGIGGVILANLMFDLPAVDWSTKDRSAGHLVLAEGVATFGLLLVIFGVVRAGRPTLAAFLRRGLHRRGLLLHLVDQLRQPRRHRGPDVLRHLRRHRTGVGSRLHPGAVRGRCGRRVRDADHLPRGRPGRVAAGRQVVAASSVRSPPSSPDAPNRNRSGVSQAGPNTEWTMAR